MDANDGNNWGNLALVDGGRKTPRTADDELERTIRALFFAMRDRDGVAVNKNFRNVARGHTRPLRALIRRLKEAKEARNDAHNYPLAKQAVREIDAYVDRLYRLQMAHHTTGEFTPPPAAPARRAA